MVKEQVLETKRQKKHGRKTVTRGQENCSTAIFRIIFIELAVALRCCHAENLGTASSKTRAQ